MANLKQPEEMSNLRRRLRNPGTREITAGDWSWHRGSEEALGQSPGTGRVFVVDFTAP